VKPQDRGPGEAEHAPRRVGPDLLQGGSGRGGSAGGGPPREGEETLQGSIEVVTFHRPESLYTVLRVAPDPGFRDPGSTAMFRESRLVAVGNMPEPGEGLRVRLHGRWATHPSHGRQFEFSDFEVLAPADAAGLERYLASKAFEGIGEVLAHRIVETLGPRALEVIREHPERLAEVQGLKAKARTALVETVRREFAAHQLHAFLRGSGLGPRQSAAVARSLGPESEALLREDPYRLAGKVEGIGFAIADRLALRLGFTPAGPERVRAGLLHTLREASGDGHTLLGQAELRAGVRELLEVPLTDAELGAALEELIARREVTLESTLGDEPLVYLPWLSACEAGVAASVEAMLARRQAARPLAVESELRSMEDLQGVHLHAKQRAAVLGLLAEPLALLTGGPGVGKTTIIQWVVRLAQGAGARVLLASPTGRAAKRLSEASGCDASTVHRLLGWDPAAGSFLHNAANPLECDLLVVDEVSMLDVVLAHQLLRAVVAPTRVVLVGDPDQLPPVGPGNVLMDLLGSGRVPVHRLTEVYRQQGGSLIVENAHRILRGEEPRLPPRGDLSSDFYFFPADDPATAAERVVEVVTQRIPQSFGLHWVEDVQVLAPMYRGDCGVDALNQRLRQALGDPGLEVTSGGRTWRVGDRVVQTRNDYEKEVFNGDMGRIVSLDGAGSVLVRFPDRDVAYSADALGDLQPAFAITVHRSQGSEYPAVVLPLVTAHAMMLQRNLLYTAVTRARRLLVLVGSRRALQMAIQNAEPSHRRSALALRLRPTGVPGPGGGPLREQGPPQGPG
jgi:exodeoxyribonuclease V alpha subunit